MKHTIAVNRQLFNVKEIASEVDINNLQDGQFAVFAVDSTTSIPADTTFENLPKEFHIVSKLGGQTYHSFDTIKKDAMTNFQTSPYVPTQGNIWEGEITCCSCMEFASLRVELDEDNLMRERGLSWTASDRFNVQAPSELSCTCVCGEDAKKHLNNHIMTRELYNQVMTSGSSFYTAEVKIKGGSTFANLAEIDAHIEANKENDEAANLILVLKGKEMPLTYVDASGTFNYIYPRGVRILPSVSINNGECMVQFTETQELKVEVNAGPDMRAEEWETMEYYTTMNGFRQLPDGMPSGQIHYQFDNEKKYNTVNFEFFTPKVNKNDGDKRSFGVMLGAESNTVYTALKTMFMPN